MSEDPAGGAQAPSVLWKAFAVLGAFSHRRRVLTLAEISRSSRLPKSTAHRVLAMLTEVVPVEQVEGGYRIRLRMFSMGTLPPESALREAALPHLEELHRITGHTLYLAILRDADVVYLENLPPRRVGAARRPRSATGSPRPAPGSGRCCSPSLPVCPLPHSPATVTADRPVAWVARGSAA